MLTKRTFLMAATGLFIGYVAAAQTTAPAAAAGPTPVDLLTWITWGAAGIVLLMTILTAGSLTGAGRVRAQALAATTPPDEADTTPATDTIPVAATPEVAAPVPVAAEPLFTAEPALV